MTFITTTNTTPPPEKNGSKLPSKPSALDAHSQPHYLPTGLPRSDDSPTYQTALDAVERNVASQVDALPEPPDLTGQIIFDGEEYTFYGGFADVWRGRWSNGSTTQLVRNKSMTTLVFKNCVSRWLLKCCDPMSLKVITARN
jgi:hypothetical protein